MKKALDPASLTSDGLVERWKEWLDETKNEALGLYWYRFLFENVNLMGATNATLRDTGGHVIDWIRTLHQTHFLISIRRELEGGGNNKTLISFLYELEKYSETVLTRNRYVALYDDNSSLKKYGLADQHFSDKFGATCRYPRTQHENDYISADSVRRTRESLETFAKPVLDYANWVIAHRTKVETDEITWADVYRTINRIFDTYERYYNIMTASSWAERYPVAQYNWLAPFRVAWVTSDFKTWKPPKA